ncbi:MAG: MBL fold metallo-hydrolase [Archangium sp.]|nr:MBL fold metallo-hydrolase [Archangium sp.]
MALSRRSKILLSLPVVLTALLVITWFIFTRHVPWKIPPQHQPPASWRVPVQPGHGLTLRSLGVSGFELTDGTTTVLMDPTPTRPDPLALITGPIDADPELGAKVCPKADVILVNHTHFDHALDVGAIAKRTGALVVGSQNTVNLALSRGVPKEKTRVVKSGDQLAVGGFTIDVRASRHTDLLVSQPMSGVVSPEAKALWFWSYALDDTLTYRLEAAGTTVWFHPTSTYAPAELGGLTARTLIIGVTGEKQTKARVEGLLAESRATRVLPTHYDNFFQPYERGLALMPGLDLDHPRQLFLDADPKLEWGVLELGETIALPPDAE